MLVSEQHVIEEVDIAEEDVERNPPGVHLRYNHTEPLVMRDGVDFIAVIKESEDTYRIDYWGYSFGRLRINSQGVEEIGQLLTQEVEGIPSWTIDSETVDADNLPWWIPDQFEIDASYACDRCNESASVQDIVTPRTVPERVEGEVFCTDCWEELR